jgi:N-acetylmuramoyl-L-alanine amidase
MAAEVQEFNIVWRGSPNDWVGRDGEDIVAICDHIMQGTEESSDGWFKNRASEVSAHFGVAKDGRIWQWVAEENAAWANGIPEIPDRSIPWLDDCLNRDQNPNRLTISIEHEGNTGEPFTEEQYQATLWLHRYLLARHPGIKADRKHIIGHYQISLISRPNCPGSAFPWQRLMDDLGANSLTTEQEHKPTVIETFNVGPGVQAELNRRGLTAVTNEMYFSPNAGQIGLGQTSHTWAKDATGKVFIAIAIELISGATNKPTGEWEIKIVLEV